MPLFLSDCHSQYASRNYTDHSSGTVMTENAATLTDTPAPTLANNAAALSVKVRQPEFRGEWLRVACWTMLDAVAGAVRMTSKRNRAIGPGLTRVALSLACVLATEFLCCLALALRGVVTLHQPFHMQGFLQLIGYGGVMLLLFSWPGWVAAVPAVLWLTDLRAWRFWVMLALGTAIGPLTELVELAVLSHGRWKIGWFAVLFFPIIVAGISTLLYLLLLRGLQSRQVRRDSLMSGGEQGAAQF